MAVRDISDLDSGADCRSGAARRRSVASLVMRWCVARQNLGELSVLDVAAGAEADLTLG